MIFKLHYGLWYGGLVGVLPIMFPYAIHYAGATATQQGTLYTIVPFIALFAKTTLCSFSDKYRLHKQALILSILTTMLGYGSLAIYPIFFVDVAKDHKPIIWALYCGAAILGNTSLCVVNSLGDTLAINSCKKNKCTYGEYRMWGPVGFGVLGALGIFANKLTNLPYLVPGILTLIMLHLVDVILLISWKDKDELRLVCNTEPDDKNRISDEDIWHQQIEETNANKLVELSKNDSEGGAQRLMASGEQSSLEKNKNQIGRFHLFWLLCRDNKPMIGFILLFTLCGVLTSVQWQFFFGYIRELTQKQNEDFSLLTTLILPVQALGGELIFFFFSGKILARLGPTCTLTICFFSFALRHLSYAYIIPLVSSIYYILLVELLQGPAFGLMYCVLIHQAQYYSGRVDDIVIKYNLSQVYKSSLSATIQGLFGAAFEVSYFLCIREKFGRQ